MSESQNLEQLAQAWRGELREKNLAGRILADYQMIKKLRGQNCPWHRIAQSMGEGVNPDSLRKIFGRVERRIKAGSLEPPESKPTGAGKAAKTASAPTKTPAAADDFEAETGFRRPKSPLPEGWGGQ